MASALNFPIPKSVSDGGSGSPSSELRTRQQTIAEITEMIHVVSLLHDDVSDGAETRRGIRSLNFVMGNKVVSLLAKVVEHLVTGPELTCKSCEASCYSCKAIAIPTGQTAEVLMLAYDYGKNLGLAYQLIDDVLDFTGTTVSLGKPSLLDIHHGIVTAPLLFAMAEFPQLRTVVDGGFDDPANIDLALKYLGKSNGIQRARELASQHAKLAAAAIESLPESDDEDVQRSRRALVDHS